MCLRLHGSLEAGELAQTESYFTWKARTKDVIRSRKLDSQAYFLQTHGNEDHKNDKQSLELYLDAAKEFHSASMVSAGYLLEKGLGGHNDAAQSFDMYKRAEKSLFCTWYGDDGAGLKRVGVEVNGTCIVRCT